jgi:two-component system, NarL family, sensor kinase
MKVCWYILASLSLLCISIELPAQLSQIDSFTLAIKNAKSDSERLLFRTRLSLQSAKLDFEKAQKELDDIKKASLEKKLYTIYSYAVTINGSIYYEKGDYINAIIYYQEAEKLNLGLPDGENKFRRLGGLYNDMGASYSLINDLDNAQNYYNRSIEIYEKYKDSAGLVLAYFNLAFVFIDMQEWEKALQYLKKSIASARQNHKSADLLSSYARAAAICFKIKRINEGEGLLEECNSLLSLIELDLDRIYYHNAYGEYYYAKGKMEAALHSHRTAYKYSLLWKDPYYIADEALDIGRLYMKLSKVDSAEKFFRIAYDTARVYNYMPKIRLVLNEWAAYYANGGNYKRAYELRTELLNFTDSLITLQNHNHILLFDAAYQSTRKENQIMQLESDKRLQQLSIKQKSTLNYILISGAATLLVISLLSYRTYKQKQKLQQQRINELETEKQLTATEAVLKGEEQERTRLAKDLHDGLGGMLSGIKYSFQTMKGNLVMTPENHQAFERSMDMLDSSIKEMRRVAHNMMPEALVKFGLDTALKDFCNDINQSGALQVNYQSIGMENQSIEQTSAIAIYRIVQELINNTMKHAAAKTAIVQVSKTNGEISITVEDDGKGFNPLILQSAKGIGWSNIQSRIEYLKGKLDIQSDPGKGTSIHIELNT